MIHEIEERINQTAMELEKIIKQNLPEDELENLIRKRLGAVIYLSALSMTYQEWLEKVLELLKNDRDYVDSKY